MAATLGSIATPIVVTATLDTTAARAAQLMREHHVGALIVVDAQADSGGAVGIVTDRDLVLAVMAEELDPALFTVGDVMTVELVTAGVDVDVFDAMALLGRHRLRRLIVCDDAGRLFGIATLEDMLATLAAGLGTLSAALAGARDRERKERR